jgi:polysaccharide pyruvyl transferase WcaK-like protein
MHFHAEDLADHGFRHLSEIVGVMTEDISTRVCGVEPVDRPWPGQESRVTAVRAVLPKLGRIGLLGHCGTGNLGDDATVAAVLQHIKSRLPTAYVAGLSMDPEDSARRHGIPCFAMRQSVFPFEREWSSASRPANPRRYADTLKATFKKTGPLFRAAKAVRNATIVRPAQFIREIMFLGRSLFLVCNLDLIVVCGGGQLLDWGGPWAFPYTLFKWSVIAKCARTKCIFLNSGAGPLDASLSRWFIKRALSMAKYISLRDRASGDLLRKIGFRGKINTVADSVWGLRLPDGLATRRSGKGKELVIGIAPMAYGDSSRHWLDDNLGYRRLIDSLAEFSVRMLQRGHRIKLFSSDIWFDSQAIEDLEAAIHSTYPALASGQVTREPISSTGDLLPALSRVDCYVTCRFHGVIFASLVNVPSLALAPHPKVTTLMKDMGLSEYCVDITKCNAEWLTAGLDRLVTNTDDVKRRIRRHVERCQLLLASQFDSLFQASANTDTKDEDLLPIRSGR